MRKQKWLGTIACIGLGLLLAKLRNSFPDLIVPFGIGVGIALYICSRVFFGRMDVASRLCIWLVPIFVGGAIAVTGAVSPQYYWRSDFALFMLAVGLPPFLFDIALLVRNAQEWPERNVDD